MREKYMLAQDDLPASRSERLSQDSSRGSRLRCNQLTGKRAFRAEEGKRGKRRFPDGRNPRR